MKYHSTECEYRIISCKFCLKKIKAYTFENHEKTECTQEVKCKKCNLIMKRGYFWSKHYNENNENVECLKGQKDYYQKLFEQSEKKLKDLKITNDRETTKYRNDIKRVEEEKNKIKNENIKLQKDIDDYKDRIKNLYDRTINDYEDEDEDEGEEKDEEEYEDEDKDENEDEKKYNTMDNRIQQSKDSRTTPDHNYLLMTSADRFRRFNYY